MKRKIGTLLLNADILVTADEAFQAIEEIKVARPSDVTDLQP
jgi:hypothetical protein